MAKYSTKDVKTPKNGYECYLINGYAYRVITKQNAQFIVIYKQEELDNL